MPASGAVQAAGSADPPRGSRVACGPRSAQQEPAPGRRGPGHGRQQRGRPERAGACRPRASSGRVALTVKVPPLPLRKVPPRRRGASRTGRADRVDPAASWQRIGPSRRLLERSRSGRARPDRLLDRPSAGENGCVAPGDGPGRPRADGCGRSARGRRCRGSDRGSGSRRWTRLLGGGLLPGTLTVIAGATGVGKTQLGLRWADRGGSRRGPPRRRLRPDQPGRRPEPRRLRPRPVRLGRSRPYPADANLDLGGRLGLRPADRRLLPPLRPRRPPRDPPRPRSRRLARLEDRPGPGPPQVGRVLLRPLRPRLAAGSSSTASSRPTA